ncbi:hypothetical protein [Halorubrum miltondacostae]|uniref:Methyltransferase FkbM domain-containing protein n=1 Tax=Halorubrum miltondacostae TaxID=3076378 RepID=A0ABD5M643_9EURY
MGDTVVGTAVRHLYREGPKAFLERLIPFVYNNLIRTRMPVTGRTTVNYNEVEIPTDQHYLDDYVPFAGDRPHYEKVLIEAIIENIREGDNVCIVGGGNGVSAVTTARSVSTAGSITVFEAAKSRTKLIEDTAVLNDVGGIVDVTHSIVGENIDVWGEESGAKITPPSDLPDPDWLVLDCQGSEKQILREITPGPKIIVETHGFLGSWPDEVKSILGDQGYRIISSEPAHGHSKRDGCVVLVAAPVR